MKLVLTKLFILKPFNIKIIESHYFFKTTITSKIPFSKSLQFIIIWYLTPKEGESTKHTLSSQKETIQREGLIKNHPITLTKKQDDGRIISKRSSTRVMIRRIRGDCVIIEDKGPKILLYGQSLNGIKHWACIWFK